MAARAPRFASLAVALCASLIRLTWASKVCIVGAGIGGSTLAYFVKRDASQPHEIHVFEKSGKVGGRASLAEVDGELVEAGASIIHDSNEHLVNLTKLLGLETQKPGHADFGIWSGSKFIIRTARDDSLPWKLASYWNIVVMAWRYGAVYLSALNDYVESLLAKWVTLYQRRLPAFETPEELLGHIGLFDLTKISLFESLNQSDVSKKVINELVTATIRIQYGQSAFITALPGAVGLCGTGGRLWQVKGGNWKIAEGAIKLSGAHLHLNSPVAEVQRSEGPGYTLVLESGEDAQCDAVAVAAPLSEGGLMVPDIGRLPLKPYHHTHVTFVRGLLDESYFGVKGGRAPMMIATLELPNIPFSSISRIPAWNGTGLPVYKIFSRQILEDTVVRSLFREYQTVVRLDWAAYPRYAPPEKFAPFLLDSHHLYYVNGFEDAASALETAAVAARNVAHLMLARLGDDLGLAEAEEAESEVQEREGADLLLEAETQEEGVLTSKEEL